MNNIGFLHKSYASKNELSRKAKATEAIQKGGGTISKHVCTRRHLATYMHCTLYLISLYFCIVHCNTTAYYYTS